jgi:hypothetical protein
MKQHETRDTAEPVREWLTEPERIALRERQRADIVSGLHPERYVGWYNFTAECVEQGLRAICGSAVQP